MVLDIPFRGGMVPLTGCRLQVREPAALGEADRMGLVPTVLIVDDHPLFRDALEAALGTAFPDGATSPKR